MTLTLTPFRWLFKSRFNYFDLCAIALIVEWSPRWWLAALIILGAAYISVTAEQELNK